jgi:hypothetical protein
MKTYPIETNLKLQAIRTQILYQTIIVVGTERKAVIFVSIKKPLGFQNVVNLQN